MQHLKRVKVFSENLQPGMFVSELDRDWSETTFLLQGFTIEGPADVDEVKRQCKFVYVDFRSEEQFKNYKLETTASTTYKQQLQSSMAGGNYNLRQKLKPALSRTRKTSRLMKGVMDKIMLGEDFDLHAVRDSVKENVKAVLQNNEAMLMMTMLKSKNEDVAEHCLNVSILSIGFAQSLGYSEAQLEDIGMAALLHDVGQMKVDQRILKKKGKLNQNERAEIGKHPKFGFDILSAKNDLTPSCIDVVMSHHERLGGQGYPRGLKDEQISQNVRLISIVDVFDSLTSHQTYRKGMSVMDAYKVLMAGKNSHFDEQLILKFIKWRSIFPPGSIVEMENGEVGIVISANSEHKLKPRVLLVLDEYKQPRKERLINMAKMDLDPESKPYKIIKAYENMAFGVDLQEYAEKGLKVKLP
ncbi:HD-GYP domain-containing protein [Aliikangiella coralliicola]|uniref:HD-GYP domain-containing protein n=1 Tax=Aliikangiella coralliicola TaxID=2592383 RepID=A0A545TZX3_9GAMM|nr:HD-GYP domain-containing protein [Aliikangiella coralliicola]TQV82765.1 HD-GYP domain-containing protein [Aliikangiella coralliicola]